MRHSLFALALLVVAACTRGPEAKAPSATGCPKLGHATVFAVADAVAGELHEVYEVDDVAALWREATPDATVDAYRTAVAARIGDHIDQPALLAHQRAVYATIDTSRGDVANMDRLLARPQVVRPASCIEVALWKRQAQRFPMLSHPTELGAYILRGGGKVKMYLSGADRVGQKVRGAITDLVRQDVAHGFALVAHLHNHPFLFDRKVGDRMWTTAENLRDYGGAVAPSTNDTRVYQSLRDELGLRAAWITNGFDTAHIAASDFDLFVAANR